MDGRAEKIRVIERVSRKEDKRDKKQRYLNWWVRIKRVGLWAPQSPLNSWLPCKVFYRQT